MHRKRLGVLRGGVGENYHRSLDEGSKVLSFAFARLTNKYKPVDILVDQGGVWHLGGMPVLPANLMRDVDVVWNTAHPSYGEILRQFSIPNVSIPRVFHAIHGDRDMLRAYLESTGVGLPRVVTFPASAKEVFEKISPPWLVGNKIIRTFPELIMALERRDAGAEEIISDRMVGVHAVRGLRGEDIYILPIEKTTSVEKKEISDLVKKLCNHVGIEHYLYAAFYLHPKRGVFLKDLRLLPNLAEDSNLHEAGELIGIPASTIIEHMLERAL